jgi:hypothetical protein
VRQRWRYPSSQDFFAVTSGDGNSKNLDIDAFQFDL